MRRNVTASHFHLTAQALRTSHAFRLTPNDIHRHIPLALLERGFEGIGEAFGYVGFDDQAVDYDVDPVLFVTVQVRRLFGGVLLPVMRRCACLRYVMPLLITNRHDA